MKIFFVTVLLSFKLMASPFAYGLFSIIPGLGQTLQGHFFEGLFYFSASLGALNSKDYKLRIVGQNLWFYNMYDAWKDAQGWPVKDRHLILNWMQAFNPLNLFDPFSIGIVGAAAVGRNEARKEFEDDHSEFSNNMVHGEPFKVALTFSMVGLGEEALFRGFLFPSFSHGVGVYGGAFLSSVLFGFAHEGDSTANWFRTVAGMIFCWQLHTNKYDLGGNVFAHTWYDHILVGPLMAPPPGYKSQSIWKDRPIGFEVRSTF